MNKSELLDQIRELARREGIDLESMGIYDDEDLQMAALRFFRDNLEDVIEGEVLGETEGVFEYEEIEHPIWEGDLL